MKYIRKKLVNNLLVVLRFLCKCIYRIMNIRHCFFVPVLAYHWFVDDDEKANICKYSESRWYASIEAFEEQIVWLKNKKYNFLTTKELYDWKQQKIKIPKKSILLTFDDGEISQLKKVLPILFEHNAKGTVFVVGKYWLEQGVGVPDGGTEDSIQHFSKKDYKNTLHHELLDIQSHTYNLHYKTDNSYAVNIVDKDGFEKDLELIGKENFFSIAMPYGAYSKDTIDILKTHYHCGFAFPRRSFPYVSRFSNDYALPRIRIDGTMDGSVLGKYL